MRRPSQKASAVSFTSVAAVARTSGGSRSSTAARARYRTRMPVNSPPSPVPSQRSTVALRPVSGAGRVRLRATAATSAEARARLVSPPSSNSAAEDGPLVVGVDGALQHHVTAGSDPQSVLVHALFGVEKPGIQPVQQGLRLGRLAGPGVVERHGRRGRGVLEIPFLAPEGAAAQVVRGRGIELQGEALQDLGVAAASRRLAAVLCEFLQPQRGERQPGHVVVVVVDEGQEIAQPDPGDQLGGQPAGAGPVLAVEPRAGTALGAEFAAAGVHEAVHVVRLPPVVPRPGEVFHAARGPHDRGDVRPRQEEEPLPEQPGHRAGRLVCPEGPVGGGGNLGCGSWLQPNRGSASGPGSCAASRGEGAECPHSS